MEKILDGFIKDMDNLENWTGIKKLEFNLSEKFSPGIHRSILKVVQYLKNIEFEKPAKKVNDFKRVVLL